MIKYLKDNNIWGLDFDEDEIKESHIDNQYLYEIEKDLLNIYLETLQSNSEYKKLEDILDNDSNIFALYQICPSPKKVLEIRTAIVKNNNKILLENVENKY